MTWTIEKELTSLAESSLICEAIYKLGLVTEEERGNVMDIQICQPWLRGGSETYNCRFNIVFENRICRYIVKALVGSSFAISKDDVLQTWNFKRSLLNSRGIEVPKLYFSGKATLIEEVVQFKLSEYLKLNIVQHNLLHSLVKYMLVLEDLRFKGVCYYSDLMTNGSSVMPVDFGVDMGTPYSDKFVRGEAALQLCHWLNREGLMRYIPILRDILRTAYPMEQVSSFFKEVNSNE